MGANMLRNILRRATTAAVASASFAANAAYDVDILPPASPIAQQIYDLHFAILWVCVGIFVIVFGAMFYSIFKFRKSNGAKADVNFHESTLIEVIWTTIPFGIPLLTSPVPPSVLTVTGTTGQYRATAALPRITQNYQAVAGWTGGPQDTVHFPGDGPPPNLTQGLPPGAPELVFERFFTTKPQGLGLGLSVCRTIIAAHGGTLGAANNAGRGATLYCNLPAKDEIRA